MKSFELHLLPYELVIDSEWVKIEKKILKNLDLITKKLEVLKDRNKILNDLLVEESFFSAKRKNIFYSHRLYKKYVLQNKEKKIPAKYEEIMSCFEGLQFLKNQNSITHKTIFSLYSHIKGKNLGNKQKKNQYRNHLNWIGKEGCSIKEAYYLPPRPCYVPRLMKNLINYIRATESHAVIQIAIIFAQFLIIHPFMDGNGRMIRSLVPFLFYQKGLTKEFIIFVSKYFSRRKLNYYRNLLKITKLHDIKSWIRFFLDTILIVTEDLIKIVIIANR